MTVSFFRTIIVFLCLLFCLLFGTVRSQRQVYLKLQSQGFQPVVIDIPYFFSEHFETAARIRQTLVNDLELSGFFKVISSTATLAYDGRSSLPLSDGQETATARLDGQFFVLNDKLSLTVQLQELPSKQIIFNKQWQAEINSERTLAHNVADEVVFYLIGERGIANTEIAYVKEINGAKELFVIDNDGYNPRQLTFTHSLNLMPSWSPDKDKLIYTSYETGYPRLHVMNIADRVVTGLTRIKGMQSAPAWAPDGKKIALTLSWDGNSDIYSMDPKGGNLRRLTNSPAIDASPSWSPDGREIAFTSDRSGSPQIYLMDAEGGNVRRLTFENRYNASPAWSPKGDLIAYVSREEKGFQIYTIDINGETVQRVTESAGNNENPSWSPDELKLAFASNRSGVWDIYVANPDGSKLRQLTKNGGNVSPKWSPWPKRK